MSSQGRNRMFKRSRKFIDTIVTIKQFIEVIKGIEIIKYSEIAEFDCRGHMYNNNTEEYFEDDMDQIKNIEFRKLNSSRKSYRSKFIKTHKQYLGILNIEEELTNKSAVLRYCKLEEMDKEIMYIIKVVQQIAEENA